MHTVTLCYSHHPVSPRVIKSDSTLGISEVVAYGLPASDGVTLPVLITRGDLHWAPAGIRPPFLRSPVPDPWPPETGVCMPRMQRLDTTFRTTMASTCASAGRLRVLACAARGHAGTRTLAALKKKFFVDIGARRMYDSWHRI